MRPPLPALAILLALPLLCSPAAFAATLTVAVAANAQYAFDELRTGFEKHTGHQIKPIYGSSGKLAAQVVNGAPFDVFLSADMTYPQRLHADGHATAAPQVYAYGTLVLWTRKNLDLGRWQDVLAGPAVNRIAVPNPKTAPYGREVMTALAHFKLDDVLQPRLVFGESISQTNQYIHAQVADVGFTAKAVVLAPAMRGVGRWVDVPREAYQPIAQGMVILRHGQRNNPELARQFRDFILSPPARHIFSRYGYLLP